MTRLMAYLFPWPDLTVVPHPTLSEIVANATARIEAS